MADILLSYASGDVGRIGRLVEILEQQGWTVWWDYKIRIGRSFDHVIEEEITNAKCIIVVWSKESIQSDWVKSEAAEGKKRRILAPALIDNVTIPLEFRRTEAAKLYNWKGDLSHPELKLLLLAIGEILGQPPTPIIPTIVKKDRVRLVIFCAVLISLLTGGIFTYRYLFLHPVRTLEKVRGEGQDIFVGDYKSFIVKVIDAQGQPITGAKVAWQTPDCGTRIYVRKTDPNGVAEATNMCSGLPVGSHTQTAVLVKGDSPEGFTSVDRVVPLGQPISFTYFVSEKSPP